MISFKFLRLTKNYDELVYSNKDEKIKEINLKY